MNAGRKLLAMILALVVSALAPACGGFSQDKELKLSNIGWDENVAVSNLTKVLLEDKLGYKRVEIRTTDLDSTYRAVATGELDAFQDVWLPNQEHLLGEVARDVELLDPWFLGETAQGLAVPSYMDVTTIDQLNDTDVEEIYGIEPSAVMTQVAAEQVIPAYGLKQELVVAPTEGMLFEVEARYLNGEDFAFFAWSPHWMNQRYDFRYLEDPEDAWGELNDPAECSTIVRKDLREEDPEAYAFMEALKLTEEQINDLEHVINEEGDPHEGARTWARENPDVVRPWIDAARNAQES